MLLPLHNIRPLQCPARLRAMAEGEVFDALDAAERGLVGELEDEDEEYQFSSLTRRSGRAVRNSAKVCLTSAACRLSTQLL